ncbi:MAG: hypothetical protein AAF602_04575 [Myxococcota bacterium]
MVARQQPAVTRTPRVVPPATGKPAPAVAFGVPGAFVMGWVTTLSLLAFFRDPGLAAGVLVLGWSVYLVGLGGLLAWGAVRSDPA